MAKKPKDEPEEFILQNGTVIDGELKRAGERVYLDRSVSTDWLIMRRIRRLRPGEYNRRDLNPKDP